jgi:hypothetical protein
MLELEQQQRESATRAAELAKVSLDKEQQLVAALRTEAAANAELMQAEKAAKFAAEAEAKEIERLLAETQEVRGGGAAAVAAAAAAAAAAGSRVPAP